MRTILNHKTFAFATLIIWLLAGWSGAHSHMCFDGQEPPVTVHIHAIGDHADHDSSQYHLDADVSLDQPAPTHLLKIDFPLLVNTAFLVIVFYTESTQPVIDYASKIPSYLNGIRPPLRAPPFLPA